MVIGVDFVSVGPYRRILLAVDLTNDSLQIAERAKAIAEIYDATLELLHVVEPLPLMVPDAPEVMPPTMLQTQDELVRGTTRQLTDLAVKLGLGKEHATVLVGNTKIEIVRVAQERGSDLIVLGSRERHGLSLLVDFTEDAVLHKACCDVLAVRVKA